MTDAGSEFQTDSAAHRKERFAKSVRANGWTSSGLAVERGVSALTRGFMRWLRYRGTDVFTQGGDSGTSGDPPLKYIGGGDGDAFIPPDI